MNHPLNVATLLPTAYALAETFGPEAVVGEPIDLAYAAEVFNAQGHRVAFLGDYNGIDASERGVHIVWCRSSRPACRSGGRSCC